MKKKICFISVDPDFLGGISLYTKNIIKILKKRNPLLEITWIYRGGKNKSFWKEGVDYHEFKVLKIPFLEEIIFNKKIKTFLNKNFFEIINSHALWGYWMKHYKKKKNQKIVHTYHGTTYYFYKNHLRRFNLIKKILIYFSLFYGFLIEKPPIKKADKIICVSNHVKEELRKLYGAKDNLVAIKTGVDLNQFKIRSKDRIYKKLRLDESNFYGLYVGRGGFWTKGLDRVINISKELYKLDNNYRLLIAGPDKLKIKHLLHEKFIKYIPVLRRNKINLYYNVADITFCLARYEGGGPTLTTGEAMASGCLMVCSEDSRQEIIRDNENGLIIKENYKEEAKRINKILKNKEQRRKIIKKSRETIKEFSLEKWGKEYLEVLFDEKDK